MTPSIEGSSVELRGVLSVLCTPFEDDGSIDAASIRLLVDHQLAWGVDGIVVFGLAGEPYKLTDDERRRVLSVVVEQANGAVPVIAGSDHSGLEAAVTRAREAVDLGADALMVYPPTFVKPDPQGVLEYYEAIAGVVSVPIVIQDAPTWTGVPLPVELLATIAEYSPSLRWVKVEVPPAAGKMRLLRDMGMHVLGGYGALHLAEDLAGGIEAVMPGCALPGLYLDIWRRHEAGDERGAFELYAQALPLLVFQMSSLDVFVAVQKLLLYEIGVLASPRLRQPGRRLDEEQCRWLKLLVRRSNLSAYLAAAPPPAHGEPLVKSASN
jgi:2-keto-3-deoxy-L-arabinonate dehydratase